MQTATPLLLDDTHSSNKATTWDLRRSFAYCATVTRSHYENFPVASLLIPSRLRPYVTAVYAFARAADDFADEPQHAGKRLQLLNQWMEALLTCESKPVNHPVFIALGETIRRFKIPLQLFIDLLTAFKMDVSKHEYDNFDEVLHYCKHSANPIGRIVLYLFGYNDEKLFALSDKICTGLQLANFWQDIEVDLRKPRIYLPKDEIARFGYHIGELKDRLFNSNFQKLLQYQVARTETMLYEGSALCDHLHGRLALEIKCTCLGGRLILQKIRAGNFDTLHYRPTLTKSDKLQILMKSLRRGERWKQL